MQVNTRHYKADVGGPVYVLDGGETSGEVSFPTSVSNRVLIPRQGPSGVPGHWYYGHLDQDYRWRWNCPRASLLW